MSKGPTHEEGACTDWLSVPTHSRGMDRQDNATSGWKTSILQLTAAHPRVISKEDSGLPEVRWRLQGNRSRRKALGAAFPLSTVGREATQTRSKNCGARVCLCSWEAHPAKLPRVRTSPKELTSLGDPKEGVKGVPLGPTTHSSSEAVSRDRIGVTLSFIRFCILRGLQNSQRTVSQTPSSRLRITHHQQGQPPGLPALLLTE